MQTNPREEKEIRKDLLLPPGEYNFEVEEAKDTQSKAGNDMIALTLRVFVGDGTERKVRDWLLASMKLKLNRFCHATGLEDAYNSGMLDAYACEGVSGRCKITIQDNDQYGAQNNVKDYLPIDSPDEAANTFEAAQREKPVGVPATQTARALQNAHEIPDGDIPF